MLNVWDVKRMLSHVCYVNHVFPKVCVTYGLTSRGCYICLMFVVNVLSSNICKTYMPQLVV